MSTYFRLSKEVRKAMMEGMPLDREVEIPLLPDKMPAAKIIQQETAHFYGSGGTFEQKVTAEDLMIYLVRKLTDHSLGEIASLMNQEKGEVLNAIHAVDSLLEQGDLEIKAALRTIVNQIVRRCDE